MKIIGIIPARYGSTRFPGKPLELIDGVSVIQRVYEQCKKATALQEVVVATDDERIYKHVEGFGGLVEMTSTSHESGTDRCAEAVASLNGFEKYDYILNIQGDEPFIRPKLINYLF